MHVFIYVYLPLHFLAVLLDVFDEQVLPCQLVVVRKVVHQLVLAWEECRSARAHSLTRTRTRTNAVIDNRRTGRARRHKVRTLLTEPHHDGRQVRALAGPVQVPVLVLVVHDLAPPPTLKVCHLPAPSDGGRGAQSDERAYACARPCHPARVRPRPQLARARSANRARRAVATHQALFLEVALPSHAPYRRLRPRLHRAHVRS